MGDQIEQIGYDVKRRIDAICRGIIQHANRYLSDQIKGKQLLAGMQNSCEKIKAQLDRLDITVLGGQIEDMTGYHDNRRVVLGGMEEDMTKYNMPSDDEADEEVDFD